MSDLSLREVLGNEIAGEGVAGAIAHVVKHGDADGFHSSAPSRREIAVMHLQKLEALDGHCMYPAGQVRLEAIQEALAWVMGWGDLDLPEEEADSDAPS